MVLGGCGGDNNAAQFKLQAGLMRPFTSGEDERLLAAVVQDFENDWSKWELVGIELGRPLGLTRQRYVSLRRHRQEGHTSVLPNVLLLPYAGFPFALNDSFFSNGAPQCVTPEWQHGSRLLTQHVRDKPRTLIIWSMHGNDAAVSFCDFHTAYQLDREASGLDWESVNQSDRAQ